MKKYRITIIDKIDGSRTREIWTEDYLKTYTKNLIYNGLRYENDNIKLYADEITDINVELFKAFGSLAYEIFARVNCGESLDSAIQSVVCEEA